MAEVTLPQLGETVTEGTITQWFKQIGDTVAADEPLFEVSTDKVDTEVPSPVAGTLTEIRVQEGETVDVGTVIAVVGDGDAAPAAAPAPAAEEAPAAGGRRRPASRAGAAGARGGRGDRGAGVEHRRRPTSRPRAGRRPRPRPRPASRHRPSRRRPSRHRRRRRAKGVLLSPVVRRLVNEHGLDPATINGTGPGGRITRDDVLDHIDKSGGQPAAAPAPPTVEPEPAEESGRRLPAAGSQRRAGRRRPRRRRSRRPPRRSSRASATRRSR